MKRLHCTTSVHRSPRFRFPFRVEVQKLRKSRISLVPLPVTLNTVIVYIMAKFAVTGCSHFPLAASQNEIAIAHHFESNKVHSTATESTRDVIKSLHEIEMQSVQNKQCHSRKNKKIS